MANQRTCAQPTPLPQYGQSTRRKKKAETHLSYICMILQTSTLPSGYQPRRLILEIFPESEPCSASARDAARVAPRAPAAQTAAGPSPRRSAPPAPSAGRRSRSGELALTAELRSRTPHLLRARCGHSCRPRTRAHAHWLKEKEETGGEARPF